VIAMLAMEDAGFVIGSYVITFAVVDARRQLTAAPHDPQASAPTTANVIT